jgi:hypothetical protein
VSASEEEEEKRSSDVAELMLVTNSPKVMDTETQQLECQ